MSRVSMCSPLETSLKLHTSFHIFIFHFSGSPFKAQPQNMEPSNSRVQELREAAVGKRSYTNAWMQGTYAPPQMAGQQQRFSRPPSVVRDFYKNSAA